MGKNQIQRLFLLFVLIAISTSGISQTKQSYLYQKRSVKNEQHFLLLGNDTLDVSPSVSKGSGVKERTIISDHKKYIARVENKKQKYYLLYEQGSVLATLDLGKKVYMDITFPDGSTYDFQEKTKTSWAFAYKGATVLECTFARRDGKKYLDYVIREGESEKIELAKIASQVKGIDLIRARAQRPLWVGMIVGVAAISAATTPSGPPSGY